MTQPPSKQSQTWSAEGYLHNAGFVPVYGASVLELLSPRKGERVLDLGCGDGSLTVKIREFGADVVGVDASEDMAAAARERGLQVHCMDGEALAFDGVFHSVFSNAALHWMRNADAAIGGVCRALLPGGRFVGEFGGHGNVAAIVTALHAALEKAGIDAKERNPWYFPTARAYRKKLEAHGFTVDYIELIPRPTPLPTGIEGWLATFANAFLEGLDEQRTASVLADVKRFLEPSLRDDEGHWSADYMRLRFAARKKSVPA